MKKLALLLLVGVMFGCGAAPAEKAGTTSTPTKKTKETTKGMTALPDEPA